MQNRVTEYQSFQLSKNCLNPLSANPTKWSNTLKQFPYNLPTNCLSVFDHFMGLVLKGLSELRVLLAMNLSLRKLKLRKEPSILQLTKRNKARLRTARCNKVKAHGIKPCILNGLCKVHKATFEIHPLFKSILSTKDANKKDCKVFSIKTI